MIYEYKVEKYYPSRQPGAEPGAIAATNYLNEQASKGWEYVEGMFSPPQDTSSYVFDVRTGLMKKTTSDPYLDQMISTYEDGLSIIEPANEDGYFEVMEAECKAVCFCKTLEQAEAVKRLVEEALWARERAEFGDET